MIEVDSNKRDFKSQIPNYIERIEGYINEVLPPTTNAPSKLHEAMRYATLSSGKRIRPLLMYASGQCLKVPLRKLDAPAAAIELIHAFSLVHDDLPAMDDDRLRRGNPTLHIKFGEAIAILAADALQPLAFETISKDKNLNSTETRALINLIAKSCGSLGMTGGQALDLGFEGKKIDKQTLTKMYHMKTGALITASITAAICLVNNIDNKKTIAITKFSEEIGLAFQIRDDILDLEGETHILGKEVGSDKAKLKATWPALFGIEESIKNCKLLCDSAIKNLSIFGNEADGLRMLGNIIIGRNS